MAGEKMNARERILLLADEGSFVELGSRVEMRTTDFGTTLPKEAGDGVITGYATVGGRLVYMYSQDAEVLNGSIGEMHGRKIAHLYELAMKMGAPIVGMLDSAGLRLEEVTDALEGFGALYRAKSQCSGVVPQISMIFGKCGGGLSVLAALSDFVYMTDDAKLFVNAPNTLPGNTAEKLDTASAEFQAAESGIVDGRGSAVEITGMVRDLLSVLPASNEWPAEEEGRDDLNRLLHRAGDLGRQFPHRGQRRIRAGDGLRIHSSGRRNDRLRREPEGYADGEGASESGVLREFLRCV